LIVIDMALAVFEPEAVAVDLEDVNVVGKGQLVFNATAQMISAALAGFGLAYVPEDLAQPHLAKGRLKRVLEDW
jgi:DNA-binding transcriptional LysR family regulator